MAQIVSAKSASTLIGTIDEYGRKTIFAGYQMQLLQILAWLKTKNQILGIADQLVVSATSFATMLIIARWTNASELGLYAVGISAIAILLTVQDSLITRPYSIQIFRPTGTPEEHSFSAFLLSLILSSLAVFAACAAALYFTFSGDSSDRTKLVLTFALVAPLVLTREFGRRYSFANLKMYRAFTIDTIAAICTLMPMIFLGWTGKLDAVAAIAGVGCGAGVSGVLWFLRRRKAFKFNSNSVLQILKQSWELGKWLLGSQLAMQVQSYVISWLCLFFLGATITGTYAACTSIVALANPFLFGFFNLMTPKSVHTLRNKGSVELRRQVLRDSAFLAGMMSCFTLLIYFFGVKLVALLYPGDEFANLGNVLTILTVASLFATVGAPAAIALQSAERGRAIASVSLCTCLAGSAVSWQLIAAFGLTGAAWGLLVTEMIGAIGRWWLFLVQELGQPQLPTEQFECGKAK